MSAFAFVILLMAVIFCGIGGVITIASRARREEPALPTAEDPDAIRQLARAVESLQGQVSDLSERLDFTERLLEAPRNDAESRAPGA